MKKALEEAARAAAEKKEYGRPTIQAIKMDLSAGMAGSYVLTPKPDPWIDC